MADEKFTHEAIARHRIHKNFDWVEIGKARFEKDPETGAVTCHLVMDRMPIGGFDGYVRMSPYGTPRQSASLQPQRPGEPSEEDE
jgi:hypothetical protein